MIYSLIKYLLKVTIYSYFRRVTILGKEHIPARGPVIFVANHPSALMDPLVVITGIKRRINPIAAAEFFGGEFKTWVLKNKFHMIPVYRPDLSKDPSTTSNTDMFTHCHQLLLNQGALLIFPEGTSETDKGVRNLKTGAARMALEAERLSKNQIKVQIIPIGLNYSNSHQFRSDLFVKVGAPILTANIDAETDNQVHDLTNLIKIGLIDTLLHTGSKELNKLTNSIENFYQNYLEESLEVKAENALRHFEIQKKVIQATAYSLVNQKDKAVKIANRIQSYLARIKAEGIYLSDAFNKLAFEEVVKLIVGFPLYLIGGALNLLPFMLVKKIFQSIQIKEAFRGSLAMMIGLLIFLFWYLSLVVISTLMSGTSMIGILVFAGGYFLGLYAIYWSKLFFVFSQKINVYRMKKLNRKCYQEIKKEQKILLEALNEFRAVFDLRNS
jgi:glycerol-3-phosphate O-acyltransferase / dihydroxyacetone phosphate acyltransferase